MEGRTRRHVPDRPATERRRRHDAWHRPGDDDSANVYIAVVVGRGTYGGATQALFYFDNNHDGQINEGDEHFAADAGIFSGVNCSDGFWTGCVPGGPPACPSRDAAFGGTNDGVAAAWTDGSSTVLELSHPLDDADNAHDWSLSCDLRPEVL